MAFDTTRLVEQIKIKGSLPEGRFEDQELLDLAYDAMLSDMVPLILSTREEFYVRRYDFTIVSGVDDVPIPSRSIGGTLREVKYVLNSRIYNIGRIDLEDLEEVQSGQPKNFYLKGNDLILYPSPSASEGEIWLYYYLRPSRFVSVAECGRITAINSGTNTVSLTIPSSWTTSNTFDLVKGTAHFDILSLDLSASSVGSGSITFTSSLASRLAVGDYVCLAEETCFPFIPPEAHTMLVQAAVATALESIGHPSAATMASKAEALKVSYRSLIGTRIQGAPKALQTPLM